MLARPVPAAMVQAHHENKPVTEHERLDKPAEEMCQDEAVHLFEKGHKCIARGMVGCVEATVLGVALLGQRVAHGGIKLMQHAAPLGGLLVKETGQGESVVSHTGVVTGVDSLTRQRPFIITSDTNKAKASITTTDINKAKAITTTSDRDEAKRSVGRTRVFEKDEAGIATGDHVIKRGLK